ncbi:MAG: transglycosylase SLT domain-containing protein [Terriglobales bacterium]
MERAAAYYGLIRRAAQRTGLPWWLLYGVVEQESDFDPTAKSPCGALGLMQLMPGTFPRLNRAGLLDPDLNVFTGADYLARCVALWKQESPDEAMQFGLASYNGGSGYILSAQAHALAAGAACHTWAAVASFLPQSTCEGKHCDVAQIRNYVATIWTKFEARRAMSVPHCDPAKQDGPENET